MDESPIDASFPRPFVLTLPTQFPWLAEPQISPLVFEALQNLFPTYFSLLLIKIFPLMLISLHSLSPGHVHSFVSLLFLVHTLSPHFNLIQYPLRPSPITSMKPSTCTSVKMNLIFL